MSTCSNCGNQVGPNDAFCSRCGFALKPQAPQNTNTKPCPKCNTLMRTGFVVQSDSPMAIWTYGSGIYWSPGEEGVMGGRLPMMAYACPQCGYVEHYLRNVDRDRGSVLRAPY